MIVTAMFQLVDLTELEYNGFHVKGLAVAPNSIIPLDRQKPKREKKKIQAFVHVVF